MRALEKEGLLRLIGERRKRGTVERLRMRWSEQVRAAMADIDGHADGRPLHAHMLAP